MVLVAVYGYFAVSYRNANWVFSPPNMLHYNGRIYEPSNFDLLDSLPRSDERSYTEVTKMYPLLNSIYGVEGYTGQTSLYLEWNGKYKAYGLLGGP